MQYVECESDQEDSQESPTHQKQKKNGDSVFDTSLKGHFQEFDTIGDSQIESARIQ